MQFISDNDLPKFTEINNLLASAKPTKSLSRLLQVDDKMEGNRFPVNNEESIVGKLSIKWKKLTILKLMVTSNLMLQIIVLKLVVTSHKDVN